MAAHFWIAITSLLIFNEDGNYLPVAAEVKPKEVEKEATN
jgi:hypothetical protein